MLRSALSIFVSVMLVVSSSSFMQAQHRLSESDHEAKRQAMHIAGQTTQKPMHMEKKHGAATARRAALGTASHGDRPTRHHGEGDEMLRCCADPALMMSCTALPVCVEHEIDIGMFRSAISATEWVGDGKLLSSRKDPPPKTSTENFLNIADLVGRLLMHSPANLRMCKPISMPRQTIGVIFRNLGARMHGGSQLSENTPTSSVYREHRLFCAIILLTG